MQANDIASYCLDNFKAHFAQRAAAQFHTPEDIEALWQVLEHPNAYTSCKSDLQQLTFRAAYIFETLFFQEPLRFSEQAQRFFNLFTTCSNSSAKRHYSKIMALALRDGYFHPSDDQADAIAETAAIWSVETQTRVAVKIWCVEVLRTLSSQVPWIASCLDDIFYSLPEQASISVRKRRWISKPQT